MANSWGLRKLMRGEFAASGWQRGLAHLQRKRGKLHLSDLGHRACLLSNAWAQWLRLKMSTEPSDIKRVLGADGHALSERDTHDLEVLTGEAERLSVWLPLLRHTFLLTKRCNMVQTMTQVALPVDAASARCSSCWFSGRGCRSGRRR
jgi:hypothetical protein